ncbi:MAG: hypothetical protein SF053_12135 [Bacteroidia bacterium]|nr:hypothetical protein [Bacteroidia bacterium]
MNRLRLILLLLLSPGLLTVPVFAQYYGVPVRMESRWSVGLQAGTLLMRTDVPQRAPGVQAGVWGGKNINRVLDLRLSIGYGTAQGLDLTPSSGFLLNTAYNGIAHPELGYDSADQVFHNFLYQGISADIGLALNLNRVFVTSGSEEWDLYVLAATGPQLYQTYINAINEGQNQRYDFGSVPTGDPVATREALLAQLDDTYETTGHRDPVNTTRFGPWAVNTTFTAGAGCRFYLREHLVAGVEGRTTWVADDLLDGREWLEDNRPSPETDRLFTICLLAGYRF